MNRNIDETNTPEIRIKKLEVEYEPKFKLPLFIHRFGERTQLLSVSDARKLHKELGEVLKEIPPEEHEDIRFGAAKK